jgi:hypothetical protein
MNLQIIDPKKRGQTSFLKLPTSYPTLQLIFIIAK